MPKLYKHWRDFPMDQWRWPDFSPAEIACRGNGKGAKYRGQLVVDEEAMDKLQALRTLLGKPIILNSAFRPLGYNRLIGSSDGSMHVKSRAFDVSMANHNPAVFEAAARKVGFTGFGFYRRNNFMHIDNGRAREWGKRWFRKMATFPSTKVAQQTHAEFSPETSLLPETRRADGDMIAAGATAVTAFGGLVSGLAESAQLAMIALLAVGGIAVCMLIVRNQRHKK